MPDRLIQRKVRNPEIEEALLDITEVARHQKITVSNMQKLSKASLSRVESRRKSTRSQLTNGGR